MEWFIIENSKEDDIGKEYPQTEFMRPGYDLHKPNSVWNIPNAKFPDFEPDLDYFILHKKAKLTDVISTGFISAAGFLINDKVKAIFEQFNLPDHKYYPAKVMHKNALYVNYFWLHFGEDNSNLIDFNNSQFELLELGFPEEAQPLSINNVQELEKIWKSNNIKTIKPLKIILLKTNLDFFYFKYFWREFRINTNIYNSLISEKISGLEFVAYNIMT